MLLWLVFVASYSYEKGGETTRHKLEGKKSNFVTLIRCRKRRNRQVRYSIINRGYRVYNHSQHLLTVQFNGPDSGIPTLQIYASAFTITGFSPTPPAISQTAAQIVLANSSVMD